MAKFGVLRANFRHYQCVGGPWELGHPNNENFAIFLPNYGLLIFLWTNSYTIATKFSGLVAFFTLN